MPWYANDEDREINERIGEWVEIARDQVDDIAGWRDTPEKKPNRTHGYRDDRGFGYNVRGWLDAPKNFSLHTQIVADYLTIHHPALSPTPLFRVLESIEAWHDERDARRIPPQSELEAILRQAERTLGCAMSVIQSRLTRHPPKGGRRDHSRRNAERDKWGVRQHGKKTLDQIYDDLIKVAPRKGWQVPSSSRAFAEAIYRELKRLRKASASTS